jgi:hypothetical protein
MPVIPAMQEVQFSRMWFETRHKVSNTPYQPIKLGVMVCIHHPCYADGINRIVVQIAGQKHKTLLEKQLNQKRYEALTSNPSITPHKEIKKNNSQSHSWQSIFL